MICKTFKLITLLSLAMLTSASAQSMPSYRELIYPPLRNPQIPKVHRETLPNGIQLFVLEDHELPLVYFSALIRTGSIYEPADKIGLADITGEVLRTGGTREQTGDEIDELLESIAASVETGIGLDSGYVSASGLKENSTTVLKVLADILMHPTFREDKVELAKMQQQSAIMRRNDSPAEIATREFDKLIYGPNSVYARHTEHTTIMPIMRDDLVAFHKRFFAPNNLLLAVWGDFDSPIMIEKIRTAFADWEKSPVHIPAHPEIPYDFPMTVNLIRKSDINQSHIYMGHIGGLRKDPDYFALLVTNRILGASFTGRLFNNVRSRQGLAYSVSGQYAADYLYPGQFYVACQTKSESTVQAIESMKKEVEKLTQDPVTDKELALAKDSFLNSFVFNFDTKGEIIRRVMTYAYYGYPDNFLEQTKQRVEAVTAAEVLRVAQTHFHTDKFQILVVGRPGDFDRPLSVLGDVNEIDITIPTGQP